MKVMLPDFSLTISNYSYNEIYIYHGHILYKFEIKVSFLIDTLFPPLCELLFAGYLQLFAQGLWDLSPVPFSPLIK